MADELLVTPIVVRGGGLQQGASPFTASFKGSGAQGQVLLHALAETAAADPEPLCRRVLTALQRALASQERASLTTALSRALQASHQELQAANEQESLANRVGAGVTCLALSGTGVTIAQAGPGVVYLRDAHGVRTLEPPRMDAAPEPGSEEGALQLGIAAGEIPVLLGRYSLGQGQVLLAANSSLVSSVSYDGLMAILSASPQEAANKLSMVTKEDPFFAALMVTRA